MRNQTQGEKERKEKKKKRDDKQQRCRIGRSRSGLEIWGWGVYRENQRLGSIQTGKRESRVSSSVPACSVQ